MSDCQLVEPLLTPYADRDLPETDTALVEAHVTRCAPCASRVAAERAVRALLVDRRPSLCAVERASASLRARCAAARSASAVAPFARPSWRQRFGPYALAASLVLAVGAAFTYQATARSTRLMAAELTADHLKCFLIGPTGAGESGTDRILTSQFDWHARLPGHPEQVGLELLGARLCLYGRGRVAHLMYTHHGNPVSVFMLPGTSRADELVNVLGHEAAVWTVGTRTFVLIAREPKTEVAQMAAFVHAGLQ